MEAEEKTRVCLEILKQSGHRIYLDLRFLEQAVFSLVPRKNEEIFWGSDGKNLFFEKEYLLKRYLRVPVSVSCDYLHTVIHCLYLHPFQAYHCEDRYWDLAVDVAVADVIMDMEVPWLIDQIPNECHAIVRQIKNEVSMMSADRIAAYLQREFEKRGILSGYRYEDLSQLFQRDSHDCWHNRKKSESDNAKEQGESEDGGEKLQKLSESWKDIAQGAALNADSFAKGQGIMPDNMVKAIQRLTREQYDYTEFLRKFAVMNEAMKVNMDEFDYAYYLYGLQIFGRIPLIEPLEYREEKQIREFVIVLDTSGSCSERLIDRFLNKTYNILCQSDSFADRCALHIIQCDARVQQDVRIDSLKNMEKYIRAMELRGGGGTDFRPAFAYVEKLRQSGELTRLLGLLYFTDGYGTFPQNPTDYKTAFVFVDRDDNVQVPPWAMRIYLESEENDGRDEDEY